MSTLKTEDLETSIKIWEEKDGGKICIKRIDAIPTPLWVNGWYRNPSSGRSCNYGINFDNHEETSTFIVKGGSFFINKKCSDFFRKNSSIPMDELYGGLSFEMAKKEYDIANLIQKKFQIFLNKKANCPDPLDIKNISSIIDEENNTVELKDFFRNSEKNRPEDFDFIKYNFLHVASKSGVDIFYPMSKEANPEVKKDAFGWLFNECLEKTQQSVYRYKIDGPNTRILDLMTLDLPDRYKYFIKANCVTNIDDAIYNFSSKLGEFYSVLHKFGISYHSGFSEHCTLIDTTISGVVMDIGGLSEDTSVDCGSDAYIAQIFKTTNLISYVCKNIFKTNDSVLENATNAFWKKYKNIYLDGNIEYFSQSKNLIIIPENIRTKYVDHISGDWIKLAPDLNDLYCE